MDQHEAARQIPFQALASALGIELSKFKRAGKEYVGPCPIHQSKDNTGCFRHNDDGRWLCFSCEAKGKGAIDLWKAVRSVGF